MIRRWLRWDGPVMDLLEKLGYGIVLSLLWLVTSLPLFTLGLSSAALYYAVVKSLRRGEGICWREFFRLFRSAAGRGIAAGLIGLVPAALMGWNVYTLAAREDHSPLLTADLLLLCLLLAAWTYLPPVLSRFRLGPLAAWRLALIMAVRGLPDTLWMTAGAAALAALQIFVLPMPAVLLLPAGWCWLVSLRMEKQLLRYMPPRDGEDDHRWYYEK